MAEELKTLKDIDFYKIVKDFQYMGSPENGIDINKEVMFIIKQEAIKNIKTLDKVGCECSDSYAEEITTCEMCSKVHWIKWFFNITKEDLK